MSIAILIGIVLEVIDSNNFCFSHVNSPLSLEPLIVLELNLWPLLLK